MNKRRKFGKIEEHAAPMSPTREEVLLGIRVVGQRDKAVLPSELSQRRGGDPGKVEEAVTARSPNSEAYEDREKRAGDFLLGCVGDLRSIEKEGRAGWGSNGPQYGIAPWPSRWREEDLESENFTLFCLSKKAKKRKQRVGPLSSAEGDHEFTGEREFQDMGFPKSFPMISKPWAFRESGSRKKGGQSSLKRGAFRSVERHAVADRSG